MGNQESVPFYFVGSTGSLPKSWEFEEKEDMLVVGLSANALMKMWITSSYIFRWLSPCLWYEMLVVRAATSNVGHSKGGTSS